MSGSLQPVQEGPFQQVQTDIRAESSERWPEELPREQQKTNNSSNYSAKLKMVKQEFVYVSENVLSLWYYALLIDPVSDYFAPIDTEI